MVDVGNPIAGWAWQDYLNETPGDWVERAEANKPRKTADQLELEEERDAYNKRGVDAWSAAAASYSVEMHGAVSEISPEAHAATGLLTQLAQHFVQLIQEALVDSGAEQFKVLDVASGPGEPALSIALAVRKCAALAADISPAMVEEAWRRAHARGVSNLIPVLLDGEDLEELQEGSIDALTCCNGLSFMHDHTRALAEWHRVLKFGSLMAAAVPTAGAMQTAELECAVLAAVAPGETLHAAPSSLGSMAELVQAIAAARFKNVQCRDMPVTMQVTADRLPAFLKASPLLMQVLLRLHDGGRPDVVKEAEDALVSAARQKGWMQDGGSVVLTDVYTIITATNGAHEDKDAAYSPAFRKLLNKTRAWQTASRVDEGTQT